MGKGKGSGRGLEKEKISLKDKFWFYVDVQNKDDCWEWTGTLFVQGYGRFYHHSTKECKAHRISYMIHFGSIPKDLLVCHKCNNTKCVNPNHLYVGTNLDNMKDLSISGVLKGEKNPQSKLTNEDVKSIRKIYSKGGTTSRILAKKFNVSQVLICNILRGDSWGHVDGVLSANKTKYKRLTFKEKKEIKNLYDNGESIKNISFKFNRHWSTINRIVR